jgi:Subtilase family
MSLMVGSESSQVVGDPDRVHVLVELRPSPVLSDLAAAELSVAEADQGSLGLEELAGFVVDPAFHLLELPRTGIDAGFGLRERSEEPSYWVRGEVAREDLDVFERAVIQSSASVGFSSDPYIETFPACGNTPAIGTDVDVEAGLCVPRLRQKERDGADVLVVIVDTGVDLAYLGTKGKNPGFDAGISLSKIAGQNPGRATKGHGTMCAYDVCIAAPRCTLADFALIQRIPFTTLLSDAVQAYSVLRQNLPNLLERYKAVVVSNSWGMFHPSWDPFPPGHPANYTDNPNHLFSLSVSALERAGADILFAAGNCGALCPDGRCQGVTVNTIYGANSHPSVLTVGGVDVNKIPVGYSAHGPGRLAHDKPDVCGFTHFVGSGVSSVDGGTSAATPVVAGLVAAIRTRLPFNPADAASSPAALRQLIRQRCSPGLPSHSPQLGWGVASGCLWP